MLVLAIFASTNVVCAKDKSSATLVTQLGDRLPGHWIVTDDLRSIEWQVPGFVGPFQFDIESLASIQVAHQEKAPRDKGTYRCELVGGDVLFGTPVSIDDSELVFDVAESGALKIERSRLRKLSPWTDSGQTVRSTPNLLSDWEGKHSAWRKAAGRMTAVEDSALLTTTLPLGDKSQISLRIAWEGRPDFRIDFGAKATWDSCFRLETWQNRLVFVAESDDVADLLLVTKTTKRPGELFLNVFFDSDKQTILVTNGSGKMLGQFDWNRGLHSMNSNFRILARKKGLHFYSATVTPWDGSSPERLDTAQSSVQYKEGKTEIASPTAWNPQTQEWTLAFEDVTPEEEETDEEETDEVAPGNDSKDDSDADADAEVEPDEDVKKAKPIERQVSSNEIVSLLFAKDPHTEVDKTKPDSVEVVFRTGMRFSGEISKLEEHAIKIRCPGVKEPIVISLSNLRSLTFIGPTEAKTAKPSKFPRLQIGDASIGGQLTDGNVDGNGSEQATALVWKPTASNNASAITQEASGSITFREPQPPKKKILRPQPSQRPRGFFGGLAQILGGNNSRTKTSKKSKLAMQPTLHLRSGDTIPCQPKRIDSEGFTFTSTVTDATFAPLEKIKALILIGDFKPAQVTREQRDRLLTLPRMQQEYPPTHLLLSVDGDLLRTRVTAMDDQFILSEVRLNPVKVPRERVSAIAWLHQGEDSKEPLSSELLHLQAVQSDGIRLTFRPQEFADGVLRGKSEVFGKCQVKVAEVDQLLFGQAIQKSLKSQSHQLLILKPAKVPRFVTAEDSTPAVDGQDSAMVGKQAPPIKLKNLDGSKFDLNEHRGKVVVLDFWATWCGPCIQWMPQLEEIVANYPEEKVELVTINLLQEKEVIQPALERMGISPTVLLDLDGVVSDAYQATAIPQTVIIDQQGKVARLFIGGSPQLKQPMLEALEALTN